MDNSRNQPGETVWLPSPEQVAKDSREFYATHDYTPPLHDVPLTELTVDDHPDEDPDERL